MKRRILILCLLTVWMIQSCGDEHVFLPEVLPAGNSGPKVKFIHAASDTIGMNLFLDDVKISGGTPNTITTAGSVNFGLVNLGTVPLGGTYPVTNYAAVGNTTGTFKVIFPETYTATLTYKTKTVSTKDAGSLDPNGFYTVAFVGIYPTYETLVYTDDLSQAPLDGKSYVRLANFVDNSVSFSLRMTPPPTAEEPTPAPVTLFTDVVYKGMTPFIALPRTGAYTSIQIVNTAANTVYATLANTSFVDNKAYTIFGRGRVGGTGTRLPTATRVINR